MLLKSISGLYREKLAAIKEEEGRHQTLSHFVYDRYLAKYGIRNVAEAKFNQLLAGLVRFRDCLRISTFARFMSLYDPLINEDLNVYLE
jgi:hypothetical protein